MEVLSLKKNWAITAKNYEFNYGISIHNNLSANRTFIFSFGNQFKNARKVVNMLVVAVYPMKSIFIFELF